MLSSHVYVMQITYNLHFIYIYTHTYIHYTINEEPDITVILEMLIATDL